MLSLLAIGRDVWQPIVWVVVSFSALCGLLALVHPRLFAAIASHSSQWVETKKLLERFDTRYDIDHYVLPYTRLLGAAVIAAAMILAGMWLYY